MLISPCNRRARNEGARQTTNSRKYVKGRLKCYKFDMYDDGLGQIVTRQDVKLHVDTVSGADGKIQCYFRAR